MSEPGPVWAQLDLHGPRYSQSLERGLAILGVFTPERPVLGIADIADLLGMSRSTTHRYVTTLVALGYMEQGPKREYKLGLGVTDLGMSALNATGLYEHAHSDLDELRYRTGHAVGVGVLDGVDIVFVDRLRSWRRGHSATDLGLQTGSRLPAYCTAMGKVLLAYLPKSERRKRVGEIDPHRRTGNRIVSKKMLADELDEVVGEGFAISDEEFASGLVSVAAPVRDGSSEVVAAVGIEAPAAVISVESLVAALGPHLVSVADRVSARLGYRRDDER